MSSTYKNIYEAEEYAKKEDTCRKFHVTYEIMNIIDNILILISILDLVFPVLILVEHVMQLT